MKPMPEDEIAALFRSALCSPPSWACTGAGKTDLGDS
jgi:hypothetical protein